jgi:serpin B
MFVFKPSDQYNSQDIIDELTTDNWENWLESFSMEENVVLTMPRFKFAFEQSLNEALKALGMQKAFSPNLADFSKLSDEDVFISSVKHKSFIDVNETGTEAAAVTSITFTTTSTGNEIQKIYFTVDKPFVFAITEKDTGAILFIGEVQNPEYEE